MDVDIRSESCQELDKVDATFLKIVKGAVEEENRVRSTREGSVSADPKLIGERPCGETPRQAPIVQSAAAIVRGFGLTPTYEVSSTDSNLPMSLGMPAITIGRGAGGRAHSLDEWTDVEPNATAQSIEIVLAIIWAAADLKGSNVQ
jgi:tripeptide aminopeptidase